MKFAIYRCPEDSCKRQYVIRSDVKALKDLREQNSRHKTTYIPSRRICNSCTERKNAGN